MKTKLQFSVFALSLALISVSSCTPEEDIVVNQFVLDGTGMPLSAGRIMLNSRARQDDHGASVHDHYVTLVSKGISFTDTRSISGSGNMINLVLANTNSAELATGTYTLAGSEHGSAMTYSFSQVGIGVSSDKGTISSLYNINSGTITISKSEGTYTIEMSGTISPDGKSNKSLTIHFVDQLSVLEVEI